MNTVVLDINTDAIVEHTARLQRIRKSALPVAVRQSLNQAAFDVKKVTMPLESNLFVHRSPTFFKATSHVVPATGFDINTMAATVGFMPSGTEKEKGRATEDLEEQEHGGDIGHRAFVPLDKARVAGSGSRNVRREYRLSNIRKQIFNAESTNLHGAKNDKEAFTISAIHAKKGGFVLGTTNNKNQRFVYRINSVHRLKSGNTVVNSTAIYSVKAGRTVRPKATHFMAKASQISARKLSVFFIANAERQLNKVK